MKIKLSIFVIAVLLITAISLQAQSKENTSLPNQTITKPNQTATKKDERTVQNQIKRKKIGRKPGALSFPTTRLSTRISNTRQNLKRRSVLCRPLRRVIKFVQNATG